MPTISRWCLKTGLAWIALAMAAGVLLVLPNAPALPYPTYLHLITVGWLSNLIFGVAHWMFPRRSADSPRGDERLAWAGWGAINAGLLLRIIGETFTAAAGPGWLLISALLQLAGAWLWVIHLWPRVKGR